jgi:NodT family efflux transporter outer membrane factor (OMF) lipoprotein
MTSTLGLSSSVKEAKESGSFEMGEWVHEKWWEEFEDPVLTDLIEQGLRCSPNLALAQARLKQAAQTALQKKAALYPELDLDAFDLWTHLSKEGFFRAFAPTIPAVVNDFYIGLTFSYEFDFWGKNRDLFKSALGEMEARCAETMQAELVMTTAIAYTYFELQFLLKKKLLIEEMRENRQSATSIRENRAKKAVDSALEPLQAKAEMLNFDAEIQEVESDIRAHIHKLKALAGLQQDADLKLEQRDLKPFKLALPETLGIDLIGRRPDLIAQKRRVEAAAYEVDAAKTNFYPNINLKAFLGADSVIWSQLFRSDNWDLGVAPALHLPIFTAGRIRAELYEKNAAFNQAVHIYNEMILEATQQVADSLTKIDFLLKEIDIRVSSLQVASSQQAIAIRRLQGALDDRTVLLKAIDNVLEKKLLLATLEYGAQLAEIELIRLLGGGFHE